jgi:dTDP-4-amino-4,6-dideoxygalactose transaminase
MEELSQLARKYGVTVIEDASHAIGATYQGRPVGSCDYSDITVFSFHPVKIVTTGEGGAALTNQPALCERMRLLRNHCLVRDPLLWEADDPGAWYYEQQDLGHNYRLTDIQAALGSSQLTRLDSFVEGRTGLASKYEARMAGLPVVLPSLAPNRTSAWHLYIIRLIDPEIQSRRVVYDRMHADGIGVNVHYIPIHRQPFYQRRNPNRAPLPRADAYYESALTLPLFPTMTSDDQESVIQSLERAIQ